ncbi:peptide-methionine (S)-S-oxide reductase MsrA [Methanogenium organophilum]|uniref:Peptide methionine sulfoxide reductase MsrA n=1 Tax=Methanogenium organophilum TaxID=2199 RepID=A0A9X9T987_METOG|nr:peptide-methionine (S)-S-oxide reductase MsrA [Methanogenium organophilum]WAI02171.1 peptide-methionine (S)-S-oxide reductase MsrA [Methanogenium organophilum]
MTEEAETDMEEKHMKKATFAGGCFWCMQLPLGEVEGVRSAVAGYAGGTTKNPTYEQVSSGRTGHLEAVQVTYDPETVSYETLLDVFWRQIDPTDDAGQFADIGSQYRTAVFFHDDEQERMAEASKKALDDSGKFAKPVATLILPYTTFYPAEEYHQNYATKKPREYGRYKKYSGREAFIRKTWQAKETVILYSTPRCHTCREIKEYLREKNIAFEEIDISADEGARDLLVEKTGYIGSPVIRIGDEFVFGFDREKMEWLLQKGRQQDHGIFLTKHP